MSRGVGTICIALLLALVATGCKSRPKQAVDTAPLTVDRQSLDQIEPKLSLPAPTTQPTGGAPREALQLYAQGRSALLDNNKPLASDKLRAAIELDPYSAVMFRDLGYASLGVDNDRALSAYRSAIAIDPHDVDSHVQIARILLAVGDNDAALTQLRTARLTRGYADSETDAALVDLLLGRLLIEKGYTTAGMESLERVLPVVESRAIELRARPELGEYVVRPSILRLRIADLASVLGKYDRAIALYQQIATDEPAAAPGIELRIIQTLARKGEMLQATRQMLAIVNRFEASRSSVQAYIDLFESRGGDQAALDAIDPGAIPELSTYPSTHINVLRARLLRRTSRPEAAIRVLHAQAPTAAMVRETVLAYRDAGRAGELPELLLRMMNTHPERITSINRGWAMLTQSMQPDPLDLAAIRAMKIPVDLEAARFAVIARLALERGQSAASNDAVRNAIQRDPAKAQRWLRDAQPEEVPDVDTTSDRDLALFIDEFSNDPAYLGAAISVLIRQGQAQRVSAALESAMHRNPGNLAVLGPLTTILSARDRKPEAIRLLENAASEVRSGPELYQLSAIASLLNETELSERLLRRSYASNPEYAATCNDLGYLLADANRELDFAEQLLLKAVAAEPENSAYVDSLGWVLYKRGKYADASKYLELAVMVSETPDPIVLDHAADAAYRIDNKDLAKQRWQGALDRLRQRPSTDPHLRLRIEHKLRQLTAGEPVNVAE